MERTILELITDHYLQSRDFNGIPCDELSDGNEVQTLLSSNLITLEFGDRHPNPHIKAFVEETQEEAIKKLTSGAFFCAYPSRNHLKSILNQHEYVGQPYTLELALGAAQLEYRAFDPAVLEQYRNDPRYIVEVHGFSGWISISDDHMDLVDDYHAVYLQSFGFAKTEHGHPAIAVYLRYLNQLTPEHQQLWHSKRIEKNTQLNRIYLLQTYGHCATHISVPDAILEEIKEINVLCVLIGKPEIFKNVFEGDQRPRIFGVLLRPTQHEYERAVQILDKVLSENLNLDFFSPEISIEYVENGQKKNKGGIRMLEEWLDHSYHGPNNKSYGRDVFEPLRNVRALRNKPSHTLTEDIYDASYYDKFREVLEGVYNALSTFRMILSKHPFAQTYSAPDLLERGMISHTW